MLKVGKQVMELGLLIYRKMFMMFIKDISKTMIRNWRKCIKLCNK